MPIIMLVILAIHYLKPLIIKTATRWFRSRTLPAYGRRKPQEQQKTESLKAGYYQPKPPWVKKEIIRLKAFMPHCTVHSRMDGLSGYLAH